jgi:hypothetical protein
MTRSRHSSLYRPDKLVPRRHYSGDGANFKKFHGARIEDALELRGVERVAVDDKMAEALQNPSVASVRLRAIWAIHAPSGLCEIPR